MVIVLLVLVILLVILNAVQYHILTQQSKEVRDVINLATEVNQASNELNDRCLEMIDIAQDVNKDNQRILDIAQKVLDLQDS